MLLMQAVGGMLFYLLPLFPFSIRARVLPLHAWLGVVSYTCLMFTVITGIIQWMAYQNAVSATDSSEERCESSTPGSHVCFFRVCLLLFRAIAAVIAARVRCWAMCSAS